MACYRPIPAFQRDPGGPVRLLPPLGTDNLALPCGKCVGCRSARATQWAQRCGHEAKLYRDNVFVTLTYADEHLPEGGYLEHHALQRFFRRLRRRVSRNSGGITTSRDSGIRYFACGEYGEENQRPHYHALIFNCTFEKPERVGKDLYTSRTLRELWPHGEARFGRATAAAANYIAQYSLKKQGAGDHDQDGVWRPAPFLRMSLKPAIGAQWLDTYKEDLQTGYLVADGRKHSIPRTYLQRLRKSDPLLWETITERQKDHQETVPIENRHPERLAAGERIHLRQKELSERRQL